LNATPAPRLSHHAKPARPAALTLAQAFPLGLQRGLVGQGHTAELRAADPDARDLRANRDGLQAAVRVLDTKGASS
jgi:hypothetical protein